MILAKKRGALSKRKNTEDLEWNELKVDILGFLIFFYKWNGYALILYFRYEMKLGRPTRHINISARSLWNIGTYKLYKSTIITLPAELLPASYR